MGIVERALLLLLPKGPAFALGGDAPAILRGIAKAIQRLRDMIDEVIKESRPLTADKCLPEWCDFLGLHYDETKKDALRIQADATLTSPGDISVAALQEIIAKEYPGITLSTISADSTCGEAECGVAVCGASESDVSPYIYLIEGEVDTDADVLRIANILAYYAPAHLTPVTAVKTQTTYANECGDAVCGVNVCDDGSEATAPSFSSAPFIAGLVLPGATLYAYPGTVTGGPTPVLSYQWKLDGSAISGATDRSYVVPSSLSGGGSITCTVTATNASGSVSQTTAAIVATATFPVMTSVPSLLLTYSSDYSTASLVPVVNMTGWPTPSLTYQWYKNGSLISGATIYILSVPSSEVGSVYICQVTATNAAGTVTRTSASVTPYTLPSFASGPTAVRYGRYSEGVTVNYVLTNNPPILSATYQWYKDGSLLPGATSNAIMPAEAMHSYYCHVTLTNICGSVSADSNTVTI